MGGSTAVVADPEEMRKVAREHLADVAATYGGLTRTLSAVGGDLTNAPAYDDCRHLADIVQGVMAESGDNIYDSAVGLCKMAAGYEVTDDVNASLLPEDPGIEFPQPVNPKLKTI